MSVVEIITSLTALFSGCVAYSCVERLMKVDLNGTLVTLPGYIRGATSAPSPSSSNGDSVTSGESWIARASGASGFDPDLGTTDRNSNPQTSGAPLLDAGRGLVVGGPIDTPTEKATHPPALAAIRARRRNPPPHGQRRRSQGSQRQKNHTTRATKAAQQGIQKERICTGKSQEYEFLRLGSARRTAHGSIEFKVMWKPSWVPAEDLRGKKALEEAEGLVVELFGQAIWDMEMSRS